MNRCEPPIPRAAPLAGLLGMALIFLLLCLMPLILVDTMRSALEKLHLSPRAALLVVFGLFAGGMINLPIHRIEREDEQVMEHFGAWSLLPWTPRFRRMRRDTLVAVNVGGGLIPAALAGWEIAHVSREGGWPVAALGLVAGVNVMACHRFAWLVPGIGIALPGIVSPGVSLLGTWLLLPAGQYDAVRASVAFTAGVLGPLLGADLLHLKDIARVTAGVVSIGGAGTFDGIVLSGILAALLA